MVQREHDDTTEGPVMKPLKPLDALIYRSMQGVVARTRHDRLDVPWCPWLGLLDGRFSRVFGSLRYIRQINTFQRHPTHVLLKPR